MTDESTPTRRTIPASPGQQALWHLHRLAPSSAAYTIAGAAHILSPVDARALARAVDRLVARHPALRTTLPVEESGPVQAVGDGTGVGLESVDATAWPQAELADRLAELLFRPFDLERGPLFRIGLLDRGAGERPVLALSMHHAVGDLWSLAVLLRELGTAYGAAAEGRDPAEDLPPSPPAYGDWVLRERERFQGRDGDRLRTFWLERLGAGPGPLDLPTDRQRPAVRSFTGGTVARRLGAAGGGEALRRRLGAVARSRGANRLSLVMAAFQALLGRYAGQERFTVGTPASGRVRPGARRASELSGTVGYFANPVVVRADLSGDPSFGDLVEAVRVEVAEALEHQDDPFPMVAEALEPSGDPSRPAVFQVQLVLQKSPIPGMRDLPAFALGRGGVGLRLGPLELESIAMPQRGAQFDLSLYLTEEGGELVGSLEYDGALFEAATARRLLGHLDTLLDAALAAPDRRVSGLPILTPGERRQLLAAWADGDGVPAGGPAEAGSAGELLHALVAARAERSPDAEALIAGEERWSYRRLRDAARRVAGGLHRFGLAPETRVGVFLDRSPRLVAALLGVLEAGGAYVPLDPEYPEDRLARIVTDSGMRWVVTDGRLAPRIPGGAGRPGTLLVDELLDEGVETPAELEPGEAPVRPEGGGPAGPTGVHPDHLAYVIYTSGSTGRPKGVAITHRSAASMVRWAGRAFTAQELSGVLAATSVCFDLSVFELFAALAHDGRVILARDALELPELPAAGEVTLVNTVPSAMERLVGGEGLPPSVRTVNLAGEPLRRELVDGVYRTAEVRRVLNLYGPSEDTTYSTLAECPRGEDREPTIGRVVSGSRSYAVDPHSRPVPAGVPGELLLGGAGLARGYLGRPAATAERFVPDGFAGRGGSGRPGERLYRTGDLVRWLPDGRLEFLGRLDHQVKVRGHRIELGEVELAFRRHPAVAEAVVVARGEGAQRTLTAYLVARGEVPPVGELRAWLGEALPAYMIPGAFVVLEALPTTPNGKIDRKALPAPGTDRPALEEEYVAPETEVERILAGLWTDVLGVERIGIHDSFFELGGHSLAATRVLLRVRELFGVDVPVHRLFERPTVAGLALAIADELLAQADEESREAALASVDGE